MLLQKIFHVRRNLAETKASLGNLHQYRRHLEGVQKALVTADGVAQFDFVTNTGFRAHFVATELPADDENQILFKSTAGNVDAAGLIEFYEIRPGLTEVQITVEYSIGSALQRVIDGLTSGFERYLNRQVRRLQAALDGAPMPLRSSAKNFGFVPQLTPLAH
jgi:uncharacterized membrane protein